jgi:hypothetical protein
MQIIEYTDDQIENVMEIREILDKVRRQLTLERERNE